MLDQQSNGSKDPKTIDAQAAAKAEPFTEFEETLIHMGTIDVHDHELERLYMNIERGRLGLAPIEPKGKPGRKGLSHDELIYRLAKARRAEALKASDRSKTWKEIGEEIDWPHSLKLLEDARKRLKRFKGDEKLMHEISEYRKTLR